MNKIQKLENKVTKFYMRNIDIPNKEFRKQRIVIRKHCKELEQIYTNYFKALKAEQEVWSWFL